MVVRVVDARLIRAVPGSMRLALMNVGLQWVSLMANIAMIVSLCGLLQSVYEGTATMTHLMGTITVAMGALVIRALCTTGVARMGYMASRRAKQSLRTLVFEKLLRLGSGYRAHASTSELVQVAVEGVEQLETYFASYLPQLFYALLAPLTLFAVMARVDIFAALVLLVCVPLIPLAIVAVQRWAKKLLSKYWGQYTELGDTFLENLQGLTTLKVYQADAYKQEQMNEQAEQFRRITMCVLTMQLNSIAIMDFVAYGGAAAGIAVAVQRFQAGSIDVGGVLAIVLLAADYFIPMRQLGSFFHVAMNGMAAGDKIFRLLDAPEPVRGEALIPEHADVELMGVGFAYDGAARPALENVDVQIPHGSLVALVGESGCGKSTLAGLLMGRNRGYTGEVRMGGVPLDRVSEDELFSHVTYVGHQGYLFAGTVRDNLRMGRPDATDDDMWGVLAMVRLDGLFRADQGLDSVVAERGANLSGGQRQRLAIARALLHDTPMYIFDEATSNIDVESEDAIMQAICGLATSKTVLMISHRLANVVDADCIYVMESGRVAEQGTHDCLLEQGRVYARLWRAQKELEEFGLDGAEMKEVASHE